MRLLYKACGTSRVSEPQIIWNKNDRQKTLMRGKQWDSYSVIVLNMCLFCLPDRVALWRRVTDALPCRKCEVAKSLRQHILLLLVLFQVCADGPKH